MALHAVLVWRNPDSTVDLNAKTGFIIKRSIFTGPLGGGTVTPSSTNLQVTVSPFIAQGVDGLVMLSDTPVTLTLPVPAVGSATYWVALYARYQLFAQPTQVFAFQTDAQITTAVDKEFYIKFAKVTVTAGTTNAAAAVWDYGVGDHSEQLGRSKWREPVATFALLPVPPLYSNQPPNHDGDIRVTLDSLIPYVWVAATSTWTPMGNFGSLTIALGRKHEIEREMQSAEVGTGISAFGRTVQTYADSGPPPNAAVTNLTGLNVFANAIAGGYFTRIAPFHAYLNGHPVSTRDTVVTLANPPVAPFRYDVVYLEMCRRVLITPPGGIVYANNQPPNPPGGTYTFAQAEQLIELIVNHDPGFGTGANGNFDFTNIDINDQGQIIITNWKFSVATDVAYAGPQSVNGNGYPTTLPGFTGTYTVDTRNRRLGINTTGDATTYLGVAYAMPLLVIKRTSTEGAQFTPSVTINALDLSGANIFPVAPITDIHTARKVIRKLADVATEQFDSISNYLGGVLEGYKIPFTITNGGDAGPGFFNIPPMVWKLTFPIAGTSNSLLPTGVAARAAPITGQLQLLTPPAGTGTSRRDVVYLQYWLSSVASTVIPPGTLANAIAAFGPIPVTLIESPAKGGTLAYLSGVYVMADAGLAWDETDALTGLGFTPVTGPDGGSVWTMPVPTPFQSEYGIDQLYVMPLAIIHRRNSAVWSIQSGTSNFNGSSVGLVLRPEEQYAGIPAHAFDVMPKELIDLRHATGPIDIEQIMEKSLDDLIAGELNTRLNIHPMDPTVGGTTHLQVDSIGTSSETPVNTIVSGAVLDRIRHSFSDAVDTQILTWMPQTSRTGGSSPYWDSSSTAGASGIVRPDFMQGELGTVLPGGGARPVYEFQVHQGAFTFQLDIRAPIGSYIHCAGQYSAGEVLNSLPAGQMHYKMNVGLVTLAALPNGTNPGATPYSGIPRTTIQQNGTDPRTASSWIHWRTSSAAQYGSMTVVEVDANGRPLHCRIVGFWTGSVTFPAASTPYHVSCAFVYDKPRTYNKAGPDTRYGLLPTDRISGLTLVPKRVYKVTGTVRGTAFGNINVGTLYKVVTKAVAGTSVTITAADVAAVDGESGIFMYGLLDSPQAQDNSILTVDRIQTTDASMPTSSGLTVTFSAAVNTNVSFKVAYTSNENRYWVEIAKTSRGVYGPFTWATCECSSLSVGTPNSLSTNMPESWHLPSSCHPLKEPNTFTLGMPTESSILASGTQYVSDQRKPFALYSKHTNIHMMCRTVAAYGANIIPCTSVQRVGRDINSGFSPFTYLDDAVQDPVGKVGGASKMYYDATGPWINNITAGLQSFTVVYATAVPLDGSTSDKLLIQYEGHAYQGIMGDNLPYATRVANLRAAIIPPTVGDRVRYEAVSDLHVTTAGTNVPVLDFRDIVFQGVPGTNVRNGANTVPIAARHDRGAYYHPGMAKRHGFNNAFRQILLSTERVKGGNPLVGNSINYDTEGPRYDTIMNFIPGPPSQFDSASMINGDAAFAFHNGSGPGIVADYDHATLKMIPFTDVYQMNWPLSSITQNRGNEDETPMSLIKVKAVTGIGGGRASNIFSTNFSNVARAEFQRQEIDDQNWYGDTDQSVMSFTGFGRERNIPSFGRYVNPVAGFELVRTAQDATINAFQNRIATWAQMQPERVGRPDVGGVDRGRGTQGIVTARPAAIGPFGGTPNYDPKNTIPCENVLMPVVFDSRWETEAPIPRSEQIQVMLSQSSLTVNHNLLPQPTALNSNLFYGQTQMYAQGGGVDEPLQQLFLGGQGAYLLGVLKAWAFKGSAVNNANKVRLLVNSGHGAALLRVGQPGHQATGIRPHTGYSADVYQLYHRPVKKL